MANDRQHAIVFDYTKITADITGMPIKVVRSYFDDEVIDPSGANAARTDGGDLRFYKTNVQTGRMNVEIVLFGHDTTTGAGDADIESHIQESSLVLSSTANTTIYAEYGDGALTAAADGVAYGRNAVWADYEAVWHLANAGNGTTDEFADSTGNGHDGTGSGVLAFSGGGVDFDGATHIDCGLSLDLSAAAVTLQAIGEQDSNNATGVLLSADTDAPTYGASLFSATGTDRPKFHIGDGSGGGSAAKRVQGGTTAVGLATRFHLSGSVAANPTAFSDMNIYLAGANDNGATAGSAAWAGVPAYNATGSIFMGQREGNLTNNPLDGRLFETRIRLGVLTADWIATEYANENSPATFATPGAPAAIGHVVLTLPASTLGISSPAPSLAITENVVLTLPASTVGLTSPGPTLVKTEHVLLTLPASPLGITAPAPALALTEHVLLTLPASTLGIASPVPGLVLGGNVTLALPASTLGVASPVPSLLVGGGVVLALPASPLGITAPAPALALTEHVLLTLPASTLGIASPVPSLVLGGNVVLTLPASTVGITSPSPTALKTEHVLLTLPASTVGLTPPVPALTITGHVLLTLPASPLGITAPVPALALTEHILFSLPASTLGIASPVSGLVLSDIVDARMIISLAAVFADTEDLTATFNDIRNLQGVMQ